MINIDGDDPQKLIDSHDTGRPSDGGESAFQRPSEALTKEEELRRVLGRITPDKEKHGRDLLLEERRTALAPNQRVNEARPDFVKAAETFVEEFGCDDGDMVAPLAEELHDVFNAGCRSQRTSEASPDEFRRALDLVLMGMSVRSDGDSFRAHDVLRNWARNQCHITDGYFANTEEEALPRTQEALTSAQFGEAHAEEIKRLRALLSASLALVEDDHTTRSCGQCRYVATLIRGSMGWNDAQRTDKPLPTKGVTDK